jgi:uncharacterized membrane protein YbaN (DUF454 family)
MNKDQKNERLWLVRLREENHKPSISSNAFTRGLFMLLGFGFIGIGFVGVIIPGLPTTPFMILAAACFARSSNRFYEWVIHNRMFGRQVERFRQGKGISFRGKIISISATTIFVGFAIVYGIPERFWWMKLIAGVAALIGVAYIYKQPTDHRDNNSKESE